MEIGVLWHVLFSWDNKTITTSQLVMCLVPRVGCHRSLMPTATATDPTNANSPITHSRQVRKDLKVRKNVKTGKMSRGMPILAIRSPTRSLQSNGKRGFKTWTDRQTDILTYRINRTLVRFSDKSVPLAW